MIDLDNLPNELNKINVPMKKYEFVYFIQNDRYIIFHELSGFMFFIHI